MRAADRQRIQAEVVRRIVESSGRRASRRADGYLELLINDTLYHERRRLESEDSPEARLALAYYDGVRSRLHRGSERQLRTLVEELSRRFVAEVVGNFDERVYAFATRLLPPGLWALLSAMSPRRLLSAADIQTGLAERISIGGELASVRCLAERGTLIVVPTHASNLDSIIIGYAAYLAGLPPLTYGAGLNLFSNPLMSFFMRNLGAYRVDRRKSSMLYKQVLKEYATCSLEMGYHNLFFPGGTRCRSGNVEQRLKLGLLGCGVRAYVGNLRSNKPKPNIYVAPCTISYKLVLEAETLIDDYLKETGKARYIIEDDEFSRPRKLLAFISRLVALDSRIVVHFSKPLDVFGNHVDDEGRSFDRHGHTIDTRRYVLAGIGTEHAPTQPQGGASQVEDRGGSEPSHHERLDGDNSARARDYDYDYDEQRDAQYTRELADEISGSFLRDTHLLSTNIVSAALFALLERANPELDLYRLLHTGGSVGSFSMVELHSAVEAFIERLRHLPDPPRLGALEARGDVVEIVADALKHFAIYHSRPLAVRRGNRIYPNDRKLLFYYANRVRSYPSMRWSDVLVDGFSVAPASPACAPEKGAGVDAVCGPSPSSRTSSSLQASVSTPSSGPVL